MTTTWNVLADEGRARILAQPQRKLHFGAPHIAAAPRCLGRLRRHLSQQAVAQEIDKDLPQFKGRDLDAATGWSA